VRPCATRVGTLVRTPAGRLVAVISASEMVFVPGIGFRPSVSATLPTPVSAERGEWSVTIERFLRSPEKTELVFSLTGPGGPPLRGVGFERPEPPPWMHLPIALRHAGGTIELTNEGRQGPSGMSTAPGTHLRTIHPTVRFPPLPSDTMELEVVFDGAPGNWAVPLTLTSSTQYGLPAKSLDVADSHHGVTLTTRGVAQSDTTTAVDIYASLAPTPEPRFMRSLGVRRHMRGDEPQFTLTDDTGGEVREFAVFDDEVASGRELHQVLVFPALDASAKRCEVTIPDVVLAEHNGAWTTVAVPSESTLRFGTFDVRATVTKVRSLRGPAARVFLDDGGWRDDRRLLYPETVRVNGRHGGIGWDGSPPAGEPCAVDAENPEDDAREVMLESPVVRLRGPWRLALDL
jgi:hypothetical protein